METYLLPSAGANISPDRYSENIMLAGKSLNRAHKKGESTNAGARQSRAFCFPLYPLYVEH